MSASGSYDVPSSGLHVTTAHTVNMTKVLLQEDKLAELCANQSNQSLPLDPRCDKTSPSISLTAPIVMMSMGVLGNILALAVIYSSRREAHARRTVFFVMLSGLAWTDLLGQAAVGYVPIMVYANGLKWVGGDHMCRYHGFMMTSFGLVTPLIVCCMSVERFLAIRFSYYYARRVTRKKALMTFILCWGGTIAFGALPFVGFGSYEQQFPGTWCFLNFHRQSVLDTIYAGIFSSINIIAIFIMIFCNAMVVGTLCMMRRSRQYHSSPSLEPRMSVSQISMHNGIVIRPRRQTDMEAQMIWFLCLITTAFTVCWLPFNIHIFGTQVIGGRIPSLDLLFIRMVGSNQILDPWLYVIFRKSSFLRLVRRLKAWFFPACSARDAALEEAMRRNNMRKPGRSRSYTMEATTIDRTGFLTNRGGLSSPGRPWCIRNDHDDLEALKKILEEEKKRPSSTKPSPRRSMTSVESFSYLDGPGHVRGEESSINVVAKASLELKISLGLSPSQSLEIVGPNDSCTDQNETQKNSTYDEKNNLNPPKDTESDRLYTEKQPLYVIANPNANEVDRRNAFNTVANEDDLIQRLLPSVSGVSCSSVSSEKDFLQTVPRGLCIPSVSDERYSSTSSPRNSVSQNDSSVNHVHGLSNGHVGFDTITADVSIDSKPSKYIPPSSDNNSNIEFIDDVFDTNVHDSTMLCPPQNVQTVKP